MNLSGLYRARDSLTGQYSALVRVIGESEGVLSIYNEWLGIARITYEVVYGDVTSMTTRFYACLPLRSVILTLGDSAKPLNYGERVEVYVELAPKELR